MQHHTETIIERQPTPTPARPERREERPVEKVLREIALDANEAPERFLRDSVVPKGGE